MMQQVAFGEKIDTFIYNNVEIIAANASSSLLQFDYWVLKITCLHFLLYM